MPRFWWLEDSLRIDRCVDAAPVEGCDTLREDQRAVDVLILGLDGTPLHYLMHAAIFEARTGEAARGWNVKHSAIRKAVEGKYRISRGNYPMRLDEELGHRIVSFVDPPPGRLVIWATLIDEALLERAYEIAAGHLSGFYRRAVSRSECAASLDIHSLKNTLHRAHRANIFRYCGYAMPASGGDERTPVRPAAFAPSPLVIVQEAAEGMGSAMQVGRAGLAGVERVTEEPHAELTESGDLILESPPALDFTADGDEPVVRIQASILRRRGQAAFRNRLLLLYKGRCALTGCDAQDALEAAHIRPASLGGSYQDDNGLLLRADLHALFDLRLLSFDPYDAWRVWLADELRDTAFGRALPRQLNGPRPNPHYMDQHLRGAKELAAQKQAWRSDQ